MLDSLRSMAPFASLGSSAQALGIPTSIGDVPETLERWWNWYGEMIYPERSYEHDVLVLAELGSRMRLLDVGCGTGRLLLAAARREPGAQFFGIDHDRDAVDIAKQRNRLSPSPLDIRCESATRLPFADETIDVVTMTFFLGRQRRSTRLVALAEAMRVLRPGGKIIVADFSTGGCLAARAVADIGRLTPILNRWVGASATRFLEELADAGFERVAQRRNKCTGAGNISVVSAQKTAELADGDDETSLGNGFRPQPFRVYSAGFRSGT